MDHGTSSSKSAGLLSRFRAERRGSSAIEFAIIAPIFIGMLISILETGIFFFAQTAIQSAAVLAGRQILTGQTQTQGLTASQLVNAVCPSVQALFTCGSLMLDVQTYTSFGGANTGTPNLTFNSQGQVTNAWNFNLGTNGQIVVLRLMYQWPVVTGPLSLVVPNFSNGTALIMGVTAFKVEPY